MAAAENAEDAETAERVEREEREEREETAPPRPPPCERKRREAWGVSAPTFERMA